MSRWAEEPPPASGWLGVSAVRRAFGPDDDEAPEQRLR